jgi:hypothetical protein
MDSKETAVFGIFQEVSGLKRAAMALRDAKYRSAGVSVLFPDRRSQTDFAREKQRGASKGLTIGTRLGVVIGGVFGWLTGSGALTIPRLNSFASSGPFAATIVGMEAGAVVGGILGGLIHLSIQEHRAKRHDEHRKSGGFLLAVHCDSREWAQLAETILKDAGADAVSFSGNAAA